MLEIKHLTKTFGSKVAIDDLSLTIEKGDIYAFIGHNGAGKTTTLKAITGIFPFDKGDILIDGHSIKKEPIICKQQLAYVPDNPDIYPHLTGIQYLSFIADIYQIDANQRQQQIQYYGDLFEMTSHLGELISSYSHGMKQKLVLISALIHQPKLLILDEPFVGLDPKASHILKETMHTLCNHGCAIFFSTHVLEVAEKLCNKIAIIKSGKLIACGTMEEVKGNESLESLFMELVDDE